MRKIDKRLVSPVKGIDLEESLNYIDLADVSEEFVNNRYTCSHLPYGRGRRPALEAVAEQLAADAPTPLEKVERLTAYVAREVKWAGYYKQVTGRDLPGDRGMTEEELIVSGYAWCNEQARVLCALTQMLGIPSRLVYGSHPKKNYGHIVTEVLLPEGWMLIDESLGYCFRMRGRPVPASRIWNDAKTRAHFQPIYKQLCVDLIAELGVEVLTGSFDMALVPDPLDGFSAIGYHNHFIL